MNIKKARRKTGSALIVASVIVFLGLFIYKDDNKVSVEIVALGIGLLAGGLFFLFSNPTKSELQTAEIRNQEIDRIRHTISAVDIKDNTKRHNIFYNENYIDIDDGKEAFAFDEITKIKVLKEDEYLGKSKTTKSPKFVQDKIGQDRILIIKANNLPEFVYVVKQGDSKGIAKSVELESIFRSKSQNSN